MLLRSVVAIAAASAAAAGQLATGWPMYRGDASGESISPMTPRTTAPTQPLWSVRFAPDDRNNAVIVSRPVLDAARGALWAVLTRDGPADEAIVLDAATGAQRAARNLTGFRDVYGSYPTGVVLADGSLVAADRSGLYRVGADGTQEQWRFTPGGGAIVSDDVIVTDSGLAIGALLLCGGDRRRVGGRGTPATGARRRRRGHVQRRQATPLPQLDANVGVGPYFAVDVSMGVLAWSVSLSGDFCSSALIGPVPAADPLADLADGALWVTTSTLDADDNKWFALSFNATAAWVSARGGFPGVGNNDIEDYENVILPALADDPSSARVILPFFWGDASCWPQCPQRGIVQVVDAAGTASGVVTTSYMMLPALTDELGECGAWSVSRGAPTSTPAAGSGFAGAVAADPRRVLVLASSGILYAFAPTNFTHALWSVSFANPVAYDAVDYLPPVSDTAGNVYIAWGSLLAAVDANGKELWRFTLPQASAGALAVAQLTPALDGTLFVVTLEVAEGSGAPTYVLAAY